jgi:hypothetical protein
MENIAKPTTTICDCQIDFINFLKIKYLLNNTQLLVKAQL